MYKKYQRKRHIDKLHLNDVRLAPWRPTSRARLFIQQIFQTNRLTKRKFKHHITGSVCRESASGSSSWCPINSVKGIKVYSYSVYHFDKFSFALYLAYIYIYIIILDALPSSIGYTGRRKAILDEASAESNIIFWIQYVLYWTVKHTNILYIIHYTDDIKQYWCHTSSFPIFWISDICDFHLLHCLTYASRRSAGRVGGCVRPRLKKTVQYSLYYTVFQILSNSAFCEGNIVRSRGTNPSLWLADCYIEDYIYIYIYISS